MFVFWVHAIREPLVWVVVGVCVCSQDICVVNVGIDVCFSFPRALGKNQNLVCM